MTSRHRPGRPADWPEWFEPRRYVHFDQPIRSWQQVVATVESAEAVARHSFLPLLHFEKPKLKYDRVSGRFRTKQRPIYYASHTDAQVIRRYTRLLEPLYEAEIARRGIQESVIAYRRLPEKKSNIHFAYEAFCRIKDLVPCVAIAFDIRDFFESLGHSSIKRSWASLCSRRSLSDDQYAVWRSVTHYSWVDRDKALQVFGIEQEQARQLYGPMCTPEEFRTYVRGGGLIKRHKRDVGIPQGSPISALISNIYMMDFDVAMNELARELGGVYRRYSDDILFVCPPGAEQAVSTQVRTCLQDIGLVMHDGPGKYSHCRFDLDSVGRIRSDRQMQYLGFDFNGDKMRIRSHTIARYMRRMRRAVRREAYAAQLGGGTPARLRRKKLYEQFSHLGPNNFISKYGAKSFEVTECDEIRRQLGRMWRELHRSIEHAEQKINRS